MDTSAPTQPAERIKTYAAFFDFYLGEHRHPVCRLLHYIGSSLVIGVMALALIKGNPLILLLMPFVGYSFAWAGHFFVEHNKPATFTYPWWSLMGDYHMFFLFLTGQLGRKLKALGY